MKKSFILRISLFSLVFLTISCAPRPDEQVTAAFRQTASLPATSNQTFDTLLRKRANALKVSTVGLYHEVDNIALKELYLGSDIDENSLFQAASMSKAVAAAGILSLAKEKEISPDDDIRPYIEILDWNDVPGGDKPVTLRELLSHTAGANVSGFLGYPKGRAIPTNLQVVKGIRPANSKRVRLDGNKGEFAYSGGGYQIAQLFAESVSGQPFPLMMKRLMLAPLGMTKSFFDDNLDTDKIAPLAVAAAQAGIFPVEGWPLILRNSWNNYPEAAAAGLWTTPKDYAKFARALMVAADGEVPEGLSKDVADLMLTNVTSSYGLGLGFTDWGDPALRRFGHGGSNRGYKCLFGVVPSKREIIVIMTNAPGGSALTNEVLIGLTTE
ncbi:MAG: serine hydrolase domain-containing protein [Pseudomonadota bacterium]